MSTDWLTSALLGCPNPCVSLSGGGKVDKVDVSMVQPSALGNCGLLIATLLRCSPGDEDEQGGHCHEVADIKMVTQVRRLLLPSQ